MKQYDRALRNSVILSPGYTCQLRQFFFYFIKMDLLQHPLVKNIVSHIGALFLHAELTGYTFGIAGVTFQPDGDTSVFHGAELEIKFSDRFLIQL
jgi:hypothetical protein